MSIRNWTLVGLSCLTSGATGCQLQRSWLGKRLASKPEDPAYLLDPATECRTVAAMASETRSELDAFTADLQAVSTTGTLPQYPQTSRMSADSSMTGSSNLGPQNSAVHSRSELGAELQAYYQPPVQAQRPSTDVVRYPVTTASGAADPTMRYPAGNNTPQSPAPSSYQQVAALALAAETMQLSTQVPQAIPPASPYAQPGASAPGNAASNTPQPKAQVTIRGVERGAGPVRVAIFTSAAGFPSPQSATERFSLDARSKAVAAPLETPSGKFAVAAFQDLNNDGQLNRSAFGVPKEPFGFSGGPSKSLGPPSFQNAAVTPGQPVSIQLIR